MGAAVGLPIGSGRSGPASCSCSIALLRLPPETSPVHPQLGARDGEVFTGLHSEVTETPKTNSDAEL